MVPLHGYVQANQTPGLYIANLGFLKKTISNLCNFQESKPAELWKKKKND